MANINIFDVVCRLSSHWINLFSWNFVQSLTTSEKFSTFFQIVFYDDHCMHHILKNATLSHTLSHTHSLTYTHSLSLSFTHSHAHTHFFHSILIQRTSIIRSLNIWILIFLFIQKLSSHFKFQGTRKIWSSFFDFLNDLSQRKKGSPLQRSILCNSIDQVKACSKKMHLVSWHGFAKKCPNGT